jgi:hypothetical protein
LPAQHSPVPWFNSPEMRKFNAILLLTFLATALFAAAQFEDDFANSYTFLGEDEELQLSTVPGNILLGYVSTHGVGDTDRHLLLAMFFQKGTINGDEIYFITKPVHGLRYEFKGKIERGTAKSPAEEGYFQITGKLTQHLANDEGKVTSSDRQVTFRSMPSDAPEQPPSPPAKSSLL